VYDQPRWLPPGYALDILNPDVVILRRPNPRMCKGKRTSLLQRRSLGRWAR
jgi:hypothetical protein